MAASERKLAGDQAPKRAMPGAIGRRLAGGDIIVVLHRAREGNVRALRAMGGAGA